MPNAVLKHSISVPALSILLLSKAYESGRKQIPFSVDVSSGECWQVLNLVPWIEYDLIVDLFQDVSQPSNHPVGHF